MSEPLDPRTLERLAATKAWQTRPLPQIRMAAKPVPRPLVGSRTCPACKAQFFWKKKDQKYCSTQCYGRARIGRQRAAPQPRQIDEPVLRGMPAMTRGLKFIKTIVSDVFEVPAEWMGDPSPAANKAAPRQVAMALAYDILGLSNQLAGRAFGGRHHTTVIHARRITARRVETNAKFAARYRLAEVACKSALENLSKIGGCHSPEQSKTEDE